MKQVAVVGAGLSGLACARRLFDEGVDVVVVEARDRVGGRTHSVERHGGVYDNGAQWIGPGQHRVRALVQELGLTLFPQHHRGTKVVRVGGRRRTYEGAVPRLSLPTLLNVELGLRRLDRVARRVPLHRPIEAPDASSHDGISLAEWRAPLLPHRQARELFDVAVRTVFGAEPSDLSALYFLFYVNAAAGFRRLIEIEEGAQQERLVEGMQALSSRLAERLGPERLLFGAPVRRVVQGEEGVTLDTDRGPLRAERVVMALPPSLLAAMDFSPPLPAARRRLLEGARMGATVKVMAFYERPTWRDGGLSGEAVCTEGPVSCVFDNSPPDASVGCLLGFVVGRDAVGWSEAPLAQRRRRVLAAFEELIGVPATTAIDYAEHDWAAERWTGGCPVAHFGPGLMTEAGEMARSPVGRCHWAGTETARHWCGYLEGALEAADRAAAEVLTALRRTNSWRHDAADGLRPLA